MFTLADTVTSWISAVAAVIVVVTQLAPHIKKRLACKSVTIWHRRPVISAVAEPHHWGRIPLHHAPLRARQRDFSTAADLAITLEQEADLLERGLPERLLRSGKLDYASLTSGCFSDRVRNGCA